MGRKNLGSWERCPQLLLGSAAGLAIYASATPAGAQCEALPIHAVPCSSGPAADQFTSALDNPPFVSKTTLRTSGAGSVMEHALVASMADGAPLGAWQFQNFEINWGESLLMAGLGSVARGDGLRDVVAPSPDTPFTIMGPSELTWEARGVMLGRGLLRPHARKFFALPDDGSSTQDIGGAESWSLAANTILVPVSVIVGIPSANSGSEPERMNDFTVDYVQTLFDEAWRSHATRSTGPLGTPQSYTGAWDARTSLTTHPNGVFRQATGPLNIVRPDDVFAQCGVQFRVIEVIRAVIPRNLSTFEGLSLGVGTCSSTDGVPCTVGPVGRAGVCFKNECIVEGGTDSTGKPLAACTEAERKTRVSNILEAAGQQAPSIRFTPDNGIDGLVPGMDGLLGAAPLRVIINYASIGRSCLSASQHPGFNVSNTNRIVISLAEGASDFVLAHEIGHALGLEHPDQNPGVASVDERYCGTMTASEGDKKNLMCSSTPNQNAHIHGCQATEPDAKFNCKEELTEIPKENSTCAMVRMTAGMLAETAFANLEMTAQAMPQPMPQMRVIGGSQKSLAATAVMHEDGSFECTSPEGAAITLEIAAHTLTEPRIDIDQFDWTAPGGSSIGSGTSVNTSAPPGISLYAAHVTDSRFPGTGDTVRVVVVDTTPPELDELEVLEATSCASDTVTIPAPAGLHDACSDASSITLNGAIVESDGQVLTTPIPVVDGQATLQEGSHVIEWQIADAQGNPTTARQTLEVRSCWPAFGHDRRHTRLSSFAGPEHDDLAWIFKAKSSHDDYAHGHDAGNWWGKGWNANRHDDHNDRSDHDNDRDRDSHHGFSNAGFGSWRRPSSDHDCGRGSQSQVRSSPAIGADGSVYVGLGRLVYAVNADGSEKWRADLQSDIASSPAVRNGRVFIGSSSGKLLVLDAATGSELCAPNLHGKVTSSPAIDSDGTVYVGSEDHRLYALEADGCDVAWSFETDGKIHSSPAIDADGNVYVGSDDRHLYAIAPDGSELFRFKTRGAVDSSPSLGQADIGGELRPAVFFGSDDENLYAVDSASGELIWKADLKAAVESSPGFGPDGSIYVGSDAGSLWAFGRDGTLKWREHIDGQITASPAIDTNGIVYAAARSGRIVAFDGATGDALWRFDAHDEIRSSPAIGPDTRLFVSVGDERLLAFGPGGDVPGGGHGHGHHSKCSITSTATSNDFDRSALGMLGILAAFGLRRRRSGRG